MIRIAIMLALHNNPEQANYFIKQCLAYEGTEIFIHVDQKGIWILDNLIKNKHIHILPKHYDVQWGDISQVKYVLALMKYIVKYELKTDRQFDYISIHSGNDLLVRPMSELAGFLEKDHQMAYLDCNKLPWAEWQYGGGLGRLALYWPKFFRKRLKRFSFTHCCRAIYGRMYSIGIIKGRRLPTNISFWGKTAWYTLSGDCMRRCLSYLKQNPGYLKFYENALCPDEIFFNTIVHLVCKTGVRTDNNLRYVDMEDYDKKKKKKKKTLTMKDIDKIEHSGAFFARKFDIDIDQAVIDYYMERTGTAV